MTDKAKFNWDQFEEVVEQPIVEGEDGPNMFESFARGAAQDLTFGTADEMAGAVESPIGAGKQILNLLGANISEQDGALRDYKAARDGSREAYKAAEETNPASYMAGEVLGGVVPIVATGGASAIAKGGMKAATLAGAGALAKGGAGAIAEGGMKAAALAGAKYGGLNAFGSSEGESIAELGKDAMIGAGAGAVVGGGLSKLGEGGGKLWNRAKDQFETIETMDIASKLTRQGEKVIGKEAKGAIEGGFKTKTKDLIGKIDETYKRVDGEFNTIFKESNDKGFGFDKKDILDTIQTQLSKERSVGKGFAGGTDDMLDTIYSKNQGEDFAKTIQALKDKLNSLPGFLSSEELHHQKLVFRQLGSALDSKGDSYGSKLAKDISKNFDGATKQSLEQGGSGLRVKYEGANALKSNLENMRTRIGVDKNSSREVSGQKLEDKMGSLISDIQAGSKGGYKSNRVLNDVFGYLDKIDPEFAGKFKDDIYKLGQKADINKTATKTGMGFFAGSVEGTAARGAVYGTQGAMKVRKGLDKAYSVIDFPQRKFLEAAGQATGKFGKRGDALASLLNEASKSDKERKIALMFSAAQNPNYREMLQYVLPEMFGDDEE